MPTIQRVLQGQETVSPVGLSLTTDPSQPTVRQTPYRDPLNKETTVPKQTELAYCKERMVNVDLRQGFQKCIEEYQCFSDDPCPLDGKFHPAPAQMEGAVCL